MLGDLSPAGAYARGVVVVHQELSLLPNLSVAENILINRPPVRGNAVSRALGHLDRREMMVRARAGLALLHAEIDPAMPAAELSQAERQLVEIVRALAHSARLILLDEPTSSLDPKTEKEVFQALLYYFTDRTVITACHRLALVPLFDKIIFISQGRIAEIGSFQELIALRGAFFKAWEDFERKVTRGQPE